MSSAQFDIFRVTARMDVGGANNDVQNVMYFRQESAGALTDAQVLADLADVLDGLYTDIVSDIVDNQDFVDIAIKNITQDLLLGSVVWPVLTSGLSTVDPSAYQTVALLLMRTAKSRVVGRFNLGVFRENGISDSSWVLGIVTAVLAFGGQLLSDFVETNGTWRYIVFNREFGTLTLPVTAAMTIAARSQRRRSLGIGT